MDVLLIYTMYPNPPMKILLLILIAFCLLAYTWKYRKPCIENVDDQEKPLDGTS